MKKRSEDGRHNTNRNVVVLDEKPCFGRYRTTTRKDFIYIFFGCCKRWFFCERFFFFVSYLVRISSTHLQKRIFHDPSSDQILSSSLFREGRRWRCLAAKKGLWWTGPTCVAIWRCCDAAIKSWGRARGRDEKADLRWQIRVFEYSWIKLRQVLVFLLLFFDQSSCYWFDIATMKYSASAMFNSVLHLWRA